MKALIQRVKSAKVTVDDEVISSIERGICVFVGIASYDTMKDMEYMVRKILNIRIFEDETNTRWKKSVVDQQLEILSVSQFTLYNTWKGNKPDFHGAMPSEQSKEFYAKFYEMLKHAYIPSKVKDGRFAAHMQVSIENDGPVTFEVESPSGVAAASKPRTPNEEPKQVNGQNLEEQD